MNIVADEGVDRPIVDRLRQNGHAVVYIAEESPSSTDDAVLALANARASVLLTIDKDFGELVFRLNRVSPLKRAMRIGPGSLSTTTRMAIS